MAKIPYDGHMLHLKADVRTDGSSVYVWQEINPTRIMFIGCDASGKWSKPLVLASEPGSGLYQPEEPSISTRGGLILVTYEQTHQPDPKAGPLGFTVISKDFGKTWV